VTNKYQDILNIIEAQEIDLEPLVAHTFKLEEAEKALHLFDRRETEKAMLVR
jgi:propanol-preferring alcohol dehydrogenase